MKTIRGERRQSWDSRQQQQYEAAVTAAKHSSGGRRQARRAADTARVGFRSARRPLHQRGNRLATSIQPGRNEPRGQEILCDRGCICALPHFHSLIDKTSRYLQGIVRGGAVNGVCVCVCVRGGSVREILRELMSGDQGAGGRAWGRWRMQQVGCDCISRGAGLGFSGCCSCIVEPLKENRWRCTEGMGVGVIVINSADATSRTASGQCSNFQKSSLNLLGKSPQACGIHLILPATSCVSLCFSTITSSLCISLIPQEVFIFTGNRISIKIAF